jgi:hypothetical protein
MVTLVAGRVVVLSRRGALPVRRGGWGSGGEDYVVWWCGRSSGAGEVSQKTGRRAARSAAGERGRRTAGRQCKLGDGVTAKAAQADRRNSAGAAEGVWWW